MSVNAARAHDSSGGGKLDGEFGTFAQPAMDLDRSAHLLDGVLDDGQAEAGAAQGARARLIDAIKALEDARQVFGGNADAGVADEDAHLAVAASAFPPALHRWDD